jgi:hypothetical protein
MQNPLKQFFTDTVLTVRPLHDGFNPQTAETNSFQRFANDPIAVQKARETQFSSFVETLRKADINVVVFEPKQDQFTPDCVFPNNWIRLVIVFLCFVA